MCAQPWLRLANPDFSPVRALHSLNEADISALAAALSGPSGTWAIERHESYDGHLSLLLSRCDVEETEFSVSRDAAGLHLWCWCDDELHRVGIFTGARAVARAILGHPTLVAVGPRPWLEPRSGLYSGG